MPNLVHLILGPDPREALSEPLRKGRPLAVKVYSNPIQAAIFTAYRPRIDLARIARYVVPVFTIASL
jgi:hypothetical protein